MPNLQYAAYLEDSPWSKDRVAAAWAQGKTLSAANVSTDGDTIRSYAHRIGMTEADGTKVAICCHYSTTTAKHCGPIRVVADVVIECPDHGKCQR